MPPKKKSKTSSSKVYSTKKIMEITEERRLQREAAIKPVEYKSSQSRKDPIHIEDPDPSIETLKKEPSIIKEKIVSPVINPQFVEDKTEIKAVSFIENDKINEIKSNNKISKNFVPVSSIFVLWSFIFYVTFLLSPYPEWLKNVINTINALVIYGSYAILKIFNIPCTIEEGGINSYHYKVFLKGDLTAFYSIAFLAAFAVLYIFSRNIKSSRKNILLSFIPLGFLANVLRIILTAGVALNYGSSTADEYFHGLLTNVVFITMILSLIVMEFLWRKDTEKI